MKVNQLPSEVLTVVAEFAVLQGEAYWTAAVCRAFWLAVLQAVQSLGLGRPVSFLDGIFDSPSRQEHGLSLSSLQKVALAEGGARAADGRQWSRAMQRTFLRHATLSKIDSLWLCWRSSLDALAPNCIVSLAVECDRIDVLEELFLWDPSGHVVNSDELNIDPTNDWDSLQLASYGIITLKKICALFLRTFPAATQQIDHGIVRPAIQYSRPRAIRWLASKMETVQSALLPQNSPPIPVWTATYKTSNAVQRLAVVAATAPCAKASLSTLLDSVLPTMGAAHGGTHNTVALATLVAISGTGVVDYAGAWDWLEYVSVSLEHLLCLAYEGRAAVPRGWNVRALHASLFSPSSVDSYHWIVDHCERPFLYDVIYRTSLEHTAPDVVNHVESDVRSGVASDVAYVRAVIRESGAPHLVLAIASADLLMCEECACWIVRRVNDRVLRHALLEFLSRSPAIGRRRVVLDSLVPLILEHSCNESPVDDRIISAWKESHK
jgi:hypothetical protein